VGGSLAQLCIFWTLFFLLVPVVLTAAERRLGLTWRWLDDVPEPVGITLFLSGSALGLWSCVSMAWFGLGTPLPADTARVLVVRGPYAFVRNPMAVAGVAQVIGVGLWLGSWTVIAVALVGAVIWNMVIRVEEEADLADRFGEPYDAYRSEVRCWVPTPRRFEG
jgi:protein-S-isoprenylcysteine O-methyltransferase Ste14